MKRPFLHIFIFYTLGIIFINLFKVNISSVKLLLLLNLLIGVVVLIFKKKAAYIKATILIALFLIGILTTNHSVEKNKLPEFFDRKVRAIGVIKELTTKDDLYERYILHIEKIKYNEKTFKIDEKIIFNIYDKTDLLLGDKIITDIDINEPNRNTNPKLFNYKLHLESKNIFATASTSNKSNIKIVTRGNLSSFNKLSIKVKGQIIKSLDKSLSEKNSSMIKSIVLGDEGFLSKDNINSFRRLGLSHILAVSGLHIGIIFGFIIYFLDLLKIHKNTAMMTAILIIWIYAGLIGFPPSVIRASFMFSFLAIGKIIHCRYDSLNILALAGFLMLVYRPMWVMSVGFQLSFMATFTILLFLKPMGDIINIKNKKLKSAITVILTAQIGLLPISLYYFNEFQILSILSNLIIAPILTLGIVIGFLIIGASIISINLSRFIGVFGNLVLNLSNFIVGIFDKFTRFNLIMKSPMILEIAFYYLALLIVFKIIDLRKINKNIKKFCYINFFIILIYSLVIEVNDREVSVEFIDVGQGDSCLVRYGGKNILIDTGGNNFGNFDIGENILLPYLRKTGVKTIDGVFLSHFHADHVKGLMPLFGKMKLKTIFIGYKSPENELYRDIIKLSNKHRVKTKVINKGDTLKLDKDVSIEVLHPTRNVSSYQGENDKSLVFILKVHNKELLFTGDIEEKSEDYIIKTSKKTSIDIIKTAHHGSKTSSKKEFIEFFNPKIAIIQVGKNSFGHPGPQTLKKFKENNTKIYRNDRSGLITVEINKQRMYIEGYLKDELTFLNYLSKNLHILLYLLYIGPIFSLVLECKEEEVGKLKC